MQIFTCPCEPSEDKVWGFQLILRSTLATAGSQGEKANRILEQLRKQECTFMLEETVPCVGKNSALGVT